MLAQKVPSLIPTENSQMHPLNLKKILSLHLFGIGMPKRNLFFRKKQKKFFEKTVYLKNISSLVPIGRGLLGTVFLKKGKKFARREWWALTCL